MARESVVEQLGRKDANIAGIADRVIDNPDEIAELIEKKGSGKKGSGAFFVTTLNVLYIELNI